MTEDIEAFIDADWPEAPTAAPLGPEQAASLLAGAMAVFANGTETWCMTRRGQFVRHAGGEFQAFADTDAFAALDGKAPREVVHRMRNVAMVRMILLDRGPTLSP